MLQHCPVEVITFSGFLTSDSQADGTDQDSHCPRQALVVIWKDTQSGIVTRRVCPNYINKCLQICVISMSNISIYRSQTISISFNNRIKE